MELDTKVRNEEYHHQEPMFMSDHHNNHMKPYTKDEFLFDPLSSKATFLQDFNHLDHHHTHGYGSSSNPMLGMQTSCYDDPFDVYSSYGCSTNFEFYESKPLISDINSGHGHVMDNFQSGEYMNVNHHHHNHLQLGNVVDMNQSSHLGFDYPLVKPMTFIVPDEVSCVSAADDDDDDDYYKKTDVYKSRGFSSKKTWKTRKRNTIVKGQWTIEEDRLLVQLVEKYGVRKWSHIAQMLPGRIGKQCRERWHNHLRPDIKKDVWSEEEDKVLIEAHMEIGNKWAEIAKRLPGRTENAIKNHWNATKRRQFSKRKCRSKYPRATLLQDYIKTLNLAPTAARSTPSAPIDSAPPPHLTPSATKPQTMSSQLPPTLTFSSDQDADDYDFNDFSFDDKLLQDQSCTIDSLLDDLPTCTAPHPHDQKHDSTQMDMAPFMDFKKELDLVEMLANV